MNRPCASEEAVGTNAAPTSPSEWDEATRRGVIRWAIREVSGVFFAALILFLSAGRLDWPAGWRIVALYAFGTLANAVLLIPRSPGLLAERATRRVGEYRWDMILLYSYGLLTLVKYVVAGLDVRFGWPPEIPAPLQWVALGFAALSYALATWAMVANAYFSPVVRLQKDRGQVVVTDGPYRFIRHPGYLGAALFELATPLALGSLWALIPGALTVPLLIARTALEDRTLIRDLEGYREYAERVRYRMLPGLW